MAPRRPLDAPRCRRTRNGPRRAPKGRPRCQRPPFSTAALFNGRFFNGRFLKGRPFEGRFFDGSYSTAGLGPVGRPLRSSGRPFQRNHSTDLFNGPIQRTLSTAQLSDGLVASASRFHDSIVGRSVWKTSTAPRVFFCTALVFTGPLAALVFTGHFAFGVQCPTGPRRRTTLRGCGHAPWADSSGKI
ncbi:hypothetical protein M885DRAFT_537135 [Pelagophyceae sp. CCMP2097]|nr:hypothetical protein M885DRAFT_537135 [Pelagophyceae sp. CCMP2097]